METMIEEGVQILQKNIILRIIFIASGAAGVFLTIAGGFYATFRFIAWAGNLGF